MPTSALREVGADYVTPARDLGPLLSRLVAKSSGAHEPDESRGDQNPPESVASGECGDGSEGRENLAREVAISKFDEDAHSTTWPYGVPSPFGCPDCGSVLRDVANGIGPMRFRCETGHAYTPGALAKAQTVTDEPLHAEAFTFQMEADQSAASVRSLLRTNGRSGMSGPTTPKPEA
jgi:two-component system chemotaxis response regulator CheB